MPFPLAHPAAILPLRRYCPRFFSFSALVIGSLAPDAAYCIPIHALEEFSHRLSGSLGFCLPVGLLSLGFLRVVGRRALPILPEGPRRLALPFVTEPLGSVFSVIISLLAGSWTHLLWDSFTHKSGWF